MKKNRRVNPALPDWLQTKEQQRDFLEVIEPFRAEQMENPYHAYYYDIDLDQMEGYLFEVVIPYLIEQGYDLRKVRVKDKNLLEYMNEGIYLPEFMQDFHDQKAFFKKMATLPNGDTIPWVKAHAYTVDLFLWNAMRLHQCKFQRTLRKK